MSEEIREMKRGLRREVLARLKAMTPGERASASAQARELLAAQAEWRTARSVLFYAPMPEELDIWPLLAEALAAGKQVALPQFAPQSRHYLACEVQDPGRDVQSGYYGIREPASHCVQISLNRLDLLLVPGVAFDPHGRRLGRGKGYYDQMLTDLRGVTCGVAFEQQLVPAVPVAPHDRYVNRILTPTRWIRP